MERGDHSNPIYVCMQTDMLSPSALLALSGQVYLFVLVHFNGHKNIRLCRQRETGFCICLSVYLLDLWFAKFLLIFIEAIVP